MQRKLLCSICSVSVVSLFLSFLALAYYGSGLSTVSNCFLPFTLIFRCSACDSPADLVREVKGVCAAEGGQVKNDSIINSLCHIYDKKLTSIYLNYDQKSVNVRFVVLTFNRAQSLQKCLNALYKVNLDGDVAAIDIWIDRDINGTVDAATLIVARESRWLYGEVHVHVHHKHVGLYGQWIDTWRPQNDSGELALFIEDDVDVSPMAYRWLKRAHARYEARDDIAGYSLQDQNILVASGRRIGRLLPKHSQPAFFYRVMGSWGFAPHPRRWKQFQEWFHAVRLWCPQFMPLVKRATLQSNWFKDFRLTNQEHTMWTIWFLYFTDALELFTLFPNIAGYTHRQNASLAQNRLEPGLHFVEQPNMTSPDTSKYLLSQWKDSFVNFPGTLLKFDYNGYRIYT